MGLVFYLVSISEKDIRHKVGMERGFDRIDLEGQFWMTKSLA